MLPAYEKTRMTSYMTKPAPPGGHSIGHEMCYIGPYSRPRSQHVPRLHRLACNRISMASRAWVRRRSASEDCDKIELSIMKHQRSWYPLAIQAGSSSAEAERNRARELRSRHE